MMNLFAKPKFYFLAIAPLLLATAIFRIDCPVCFGKGSVEGAKNMDTVRIVAVEPRILDSLQDACTGYIVTKARPHITAFNMGFEDSEGWLTVMLVNTDSGEILAEQYLPIAISTETTVVLDSLVIFAFYSADIPPKHLDLKIETLTGSVPDTTCNGSGKVGLNSYFLASAFRSKLMTEIRSEYDFGPDLSHGEPGSKEWLDFYELNNY